MALSEFEKKRIEKIFTDYCENKVPPHVRDKLRVEFQIRGDEVKLFECRPRWRGEGDWISSKIARFKKDPKTETWLLYWADRNANGSVIRRCPTTGTSKSCWPRWRRTKTGRFGAENFIGKITAITC
jgi:hypothetical protein